MATCKASLQFSAQPCLHSPFSCDPFLFKSMEISIHDILKFRRALSHLDEEFLFGEAFGNSRTRDATIASCHEVFYKLLKLSAGTEQLKDGNNQECHGFRKTAKRRMCQRNAFFVSFLHLTVRVGFHFWHLYRQSTESTNGCGFFVLPFVTPVSLTVYSNRFSMVFSISC